MAVGGRAEFGRREFSIRYKPFRFTLFGDQSRPLAASVAGNMWSMKSAMIDIRARHGLVRDQRLAWVTAS